MNERDQNQNENAKPTESKLKAFGRNVLATTGVVLATTAMAHAEETAVSIDFAAAVTGVVIIAGMLSAATLKAVPTYAGWGMKKALSMLR